MYYEISPSDQMALIASDGTELSYNELKEQVDWFAGQIPKRDLVFCLCENSPVSVIGYLGSLNAHSVPLLLDKKIEEGLLSNLHEIYQPNYIFAPKERGDIRGYHTLFELSHYRMHEADQKTEHVLHDELALLLTTSGSTGSPKLVRQSYKNIQSNAEAIVEYLGLSADERPITTLPMNYTYGLSIINSHLQVGATLLMTDEPMNMKAFWTFMKDQRATSFGGVPFTYEMLKKVRFFKMDLPDLRYMTQAGGKLGPELHREFAVWAEERGKHFIVMYGQTEATARMGYLPADKSIEKYGSMGVPIPGGRFILLDAAENEITEPEIVGEMVYEGPNVTLGYAECKSDLAKGDERHGRLATGDMAKFDADGYYYIVGRKKRFLKIFGNRVNLDETDRLIKANFADLDSASTGKDDHMITYITDEERTDAVRQWLSSTLHLSESAFEVRYIDEIPKNEAGKVLYKKLDIE